MKYEIGPGEMVEFSYKIKHPEQNTPFREYDFGKRVVAEHYSFEIYLDDEGFLHREEGPAWIAEHEENLVPLLAEYYWHGERVPIYYD